MGGLILARRKHKRTLSILDVGHGNCAVVRAAGGVVVVDAGPGNTLQEFLAEKGIRTISAVLLSHADEDHIAGLLGLLSDKRFVVKRVRANSDAIKNSKLWDDLLFELEARSGSVDFSPALTSAQNGEFSLGSVRVEIVGPGPGLAAKGPGSVVGAKFVDRKPGRRMTSNSISAVVRIGTASQNVALLTGDVDDIGLDNMLKRGVDGSAHLMVFPHHGGRPGRGDAIEFANRICAFSGARIVVFSTGRGRHDNPRPEVVAAVRKASATTRVACTQLSKHCAKVLSGGSQAHLDSAFAKGRDQGACCSGTTVVDLDRPGHTSPTNARHREFIAAAAPSALCR